MCQIPWCLRIVVGHGRLSATYHADLLSWFREAHVVPWCESLGLMAMARPGYKIGSQGSLSLLPLRIDPPKLNKRTHTRCRGASYSLSDSRLHSLSSWTTVIRLWSRFGAPAMPYPITEFGHRTQFLFHPLCMRESELLTRTVHPFL